jgi:hypothetical protein
MKDIRKDEREGRPSASAAKANRLCPGRHKMCLPLEDTQSKAAAEGTLAHDWMELHGQYAVQQPDPAIAGITLPDSLQETCNEAASQRDSIVGMVWSDWKENPPELHLEQRLWYRNNRYSGKADYIAIRGRRAVVIDYKFGRSEVDEASRNDQLIWLAILTFTNYNVDAITVGIVQPLCGVPSVHTYDSKDLGRLRGRVLSIVRRIDSPHAPLRAGKAQCKYCKALEICPAVEGKRDAIARIDERQVTKLTNASLLSLLEAVGAVRLLCGRIEDEAVIRLESNPRAIPGYELSKGGGRRRINDDSAASLRLIEAGVLDSDGITAASTIQLGELQRMVQEYNEVGPKEAREIVRKTLGDAITITEGKVKACPIES